MGSCGKKALRMEHRSEEVTAAVPGKLSRLKETADAMEPNRGCRNDQDVPGFHTGHRDGTEMQLGRKIP